MIDSHPSRRPDAAPSGPTRRRRLALAGAALFAATSCKTAAPPAADCPEPATPVTRRLPPPQSLPSTARSVLSRRMARHGAAMNELIWAALLLDYDGAHARAQEIASEPRLARPLGNDATELNTLLPEAFFAMQDELAEHAAAVAAVAPEEDPVKLAATVSALTDTCMRCHGAYMRGAPPEPDEVPAEPDGAASAPADEAASEGDAK